MTSSSVWITSKRTSDLQNKIQEIFDLYADKKVFLEVLDAMSRKIGDSSLMVFCTEA